MPCPKLDSIAQQIQRRGLAVPAIFFLELHKPLGRIASSVVTAADPVLKMLFHRQSIDTIQEILESPERIEDLIVAIEQCDAAHRNRVPACRG